jgi:hypothetical protein
VEGSGHFLAERSTLMLGPGTENLLRLSPLVDSLIRRSNEQQGYASQLSSRMARLPSHPDLRLISVTGQLLSFDGQLRDARLAINTAVDSARNLEGWAHERGGVIPLASALRMAADGDASLRNAARDVERAEQMLARVVNSCFIDGTRAVGRTETLLCGRTYALRLQIGPPLPTSHVREPQGIPERFLDPFYDESAIDLDVSVHSDDFTVLESASFSLRLPRAGPSQPLDIALRTPEAPSMARLRICIYYQQNLLQSLMVTAEVSTESVTADGNGNFADVEFSMADTLLGVEELPPRTVNVLMNEGTDGTHTFVIHDPNFDQHYSFPDSQQSKSFVRNC